MPLKTISTKRICWIAVCFALLVSGMWKLHTDAVTANTQRAAWETRASRLGVPVYPPRPLRLPFVGTALFGQLSRRPQTVVQALSELEAGNLMRLELEDCPSGLVIMIAGISEANRRRLAERYPSALIVDYPNMPE